MGLTRIQRFLRHGSLPQLAAFEAVARLGSFTRAGEALHMAQPTVSQLIRKLGDSVGHPLFEQVGKRIRLTDAGSLLYETAQELFQVLERFDSRAQELETVAAGTLRVAVCAEAMASIVPLAAAFMRDHPGVVLRLERDSLAGLQRRLADNEDDLYLFAGLPPSVGVVRQHVADMPVLLLAAPDHPLAMKGPLPAACLAGLPFLLGRPGGAARMMLEQYCAEHDLSVQVRLELDDETALCDAAAQGLGVAAMSAAVATSQLAAGRLVALEIEGFPLPCEWCLAYPIGKHPSAAGRAFMASARRFDPEQDLIPSRFTTPRRLAG